MQRDREIRDDTGRSGIFGGKDPFDDPFFSQPLDSMFKSNTLYAISHADLNQIRTDSKGLVIEELESDDERLFPEEEIEKNDANKSPLVEHPEDQDTDRDKKDKLISQWTESDQDKVKGTGSKTRSVSFQRVTYGGINGVYSTATTTRRTGDDGVTIEESKQADKTTGQATHRISRGINDKGHSVTRKLDSDGKVDTMQTLHNLNEDELDGFEQAWKGNANRNMHGWNGRFDIPGNTGSSGFRRGRLASWGGFTDPFREHFTRNRGQSFDRAFRDQSSSGKTKKVVTINIE